jgi:predicted transcriptional regulator
MNVKIPKRSRSQIILSILKITDGNGARKTEILYKAYLSYALLKQYLSMLVQSDLIYTDREKTFRLTPRGMHALEVYSKMDELFVPRAATTNDVVTNAANVIHPEYQTPWF